MQITSIPTRVREICKNYFLRHDRTAECSLGSKTPRFSSKKLGLSPKRFVHPARHPRSFKPSEVITLKWISMVRPTVRVRATEHFDVWPQTDFIPLKSRLLVRTRICLPPLCARIIFKANASDLKMFPITKGDGREWNTERMEGKGEKGERGFSGVGWWTVDIRSPL